MIFFLSRVILLHQSLQQNKGNELLTGDWTEAKRGSYKRDLHEFLLHVGVRLSYIDSASPLNSRVHTHIYTKKNVNMKHKEFEDWL